MTAAVLTGLLDLNEAFGLNLASQDRIKYRKRTTCSILPLDKYSGVVNASDVPIFTRTPRPEEQALLLLYGGSGLFSGGPWVNATFAVYLLKASVTDSYSTL